MTQLPIEQAIPRFKTNEERIDTFVNGDENATYTTSGGIQVPSVRKIVASINEEGEGWLAQAEAASDAAEAARDAAIAAAGTIDTYAPSGTDDEKIAAAYAALNAGTIGSLSFVRRTYNLSVEPPAITRSDAMIDFNNARLRFKADAGAAGTFIKVGAPGAVTARVTLQNIKAECLNYATAAAHAFVFDNCSDVRLDNFDVSNVAGLLRVGATANVARLWISRGAGNFQADRGLHLIDVSRAAVLSLDRVQVTSPDVMPAGSRIISIVAAANIDTVRISDCALYSSEGQDYGIYCDSTGGAMTNLWVKGTTIDRNRVAGIYLRTSGSGNTWARHIFFDECYLRAIGGDVLVVENTSTNCELEKIHLRGSMLAYAGRSVVYAPAPSSTLTTREIEVSSCNINDDMIYVADITKGISTVITFTTTHGFRVGDVVKINGVNGMTQINDLTGTVTAVSSDLYSVTVDIDSTAFSSRTSGGGVAVNSSGAIQIGVEGCRVFGNTFSRRVDDAPVASAYAVNVIANIAEAKVFGNYMANGKMPISHFSPYTGSGGTEIEVFGNNAGTPQMRPGLQLGTFPATAATAADDLVVTNPSGNAGISVLAPNTATASLFFGDTDNTSPGRVVYDHATNTLALWTSGASRAAISSAGLLSLTGAVALGGGTAIETQGTGSPEGVVTAVVGSRYWRTDGTAGSRLYFKATGSGNTGWTAIL